MHGMTAFGVDIFYATMQFMTMTYELTFNMKKDKF